VNTLLERKEDKESKERKNGKGGKNGKNGKERTPHSIFSNQHCSIFSQ
jgi:hypothetical protein